MNSGQISSGIICSLLGAMLATGARAEPRSMPGSASPAAPLALTGTAFTYQGQLKNGSAPVTGSCDIAFGVYDAAGGGNQISGALTQTIAIVNGLFTTALDFGANAFTGDARWLDLQVRCPPGGGAFSQLAPRQVIAPAPYALALPGLRTEQGLTTTNIIGGYSTNRVINNAIGATIAGGGASFYTNTVGGSFGTVGGGASNRANGDSATVAGGDGNSAIKDHATIGGGLINYANGSRATIGGGEQNSVINTWATVGGGAGNQANGVAATVAGGLYNIAHGDYSFAAGSNASANHQGAFVWADSNPNTYRSTANDQFDIRASNGLSLAVNANYTKTIQAGERYRDNAIIAWAKIDGLTGAVQNLQTASFGVLATAHLGAGQYMITTTANTSVNFNLIPMAVAEIDNPPTSAASIRIVSVNQDLSNRFEVYINNGTFALVDNDFVFMVTGR